MPRTVFAKPGTSEQVIDLRDNSTAPDGFIEMQSERPSSGQWIAEADGTWLAVAASLDEAKAAKLQEINAWVDAQLIPITSRYPKSEVDSWPEQIFEAYAYSQNPAKETPLINQIAINRGIDKPTLVNRIQYKCREFALYSGQFFGIRQNCQDQLEQATTLEEVEAITPTLPEA